MMSVANISARDRVSKQAVSNHVKRLVEQHGLRVERDGQGRVACVNIAQYDALRNRFADPSKAQAPASTPVPQVDSYDEALRRKTLYEAERRRLDLEQLKGRLIPAEALADALDRAGEVAKDAFSSFEDAADDIAAAVARDGARGARAELKRLAHEVATRQMQAFAAEAKALRAAIRDDVNEPSEMRQQ